MTARTSTSRRGRADVAALDAKIRPLYEAGQGCRVIGAALGEQPAYIYKRVVAMGIARTRDETYAARQAVPDIAVPFAAAELPDRLRAAAIGEAIAWFLRRGYLPSIPVEPARYDLVVESDDGLRRVQVKSTTYQERGRYVAGIARQEYGLAEALNANGRRSSATYTADEVDLFFIITGTGDRYLIPLTATGGAGSLTLDRKYAAYKVT